MARGNNRNGNTNKGHGVRKAPPGQPVQDFQQSVTSGKKGKKNNKKKK